MERISSIEKLDTLRDNILLKQGAVARCLTLCGGTGCRAYDCMEVVEAFKKELTKRGLAKKVAVKTTGCHGFCERGPMVLISPEGIFYEQISAKDVPEIVEKTLLGNEIVDRLVYKDPNTGEPILKEIDIPNSTGFRIGSSSGKTSSSTPPRSTTTSRKGGTRPFGRP